MGYPVRATIGGDFGDTGKGKQNFTMIYEILKNKGLWGDTAYTKAIQDDPFGFIKNKKVVINIAPFGTGNAGNHIYLSHDEKVSTHLLPPGALLSPYVISIMGPCKSVNLETLLDEIKEANEATDGNIPHLTRGVNLFLDQYATITIPQDIELDKAFSKKLRNTGTGSGPAMARRALRFDLRAGHLFNLGDKEVKEMIEKGLEINNFVLKGYGKKPYSFEETMEYLHKWAEFYGKDFIVNGENIINAALKNPDATIFANATQGLCLDGDIGSIGNTVSYGVTAQDLMKGCYFPVDTPIIFMIIKKAYVTRAGTGLFPGEFLGEKGKRLSEIGTEIAVTSGNIRRTGPDNLAETRYQARITGPDIVSQIITKIDIYGEFMEEQGSQKAIMGYKLPDGSIVDHISFPHEADYDIIWSDEYYWEKIESDKKKEMIEKGFDAFPEGLQKYLLMSAKFTQVPVKAISLGPYTEDNVTKGLYEETSKQIDNPELKTMIKLEEIPK